MHSPVSSDLTEILARPPVYRLLAVAEKLRGKHLSHAWKGLAGIPGSTEPGIPVVFKFLTHAYQADIELACSLVSQILKLPVPFPALVICEKEDLPEAPQAMPTTAVLFGSIFQAPDPFLAQRIKNNEDVDEFIWNSVCSTGSTGTEGAVWDELVANPDRHSQNLLFDGRKWWLFDHNRALRPLAELYKNEAGQRDQQRFITFVDKVNHLLREMCARRPQDHGMEKHAEKMKANNKKLKLLANGVREWKTNHPQIDQTFQMAAFIIDIIAQRLDPLPLYIANRLSTQQPASLWDQSTRS